MNLIPTAISAWRTERPIEKALQDHDKEGLAKAFAFALAFVVTLLRSGKYAAYVSFVDPDLLTGIGLCIAAVVAGFGHWATRGALISAAGGSPGISESAASAALATVADNLQQPRTVLPADGLAAAMAGSNRDGAASGIAHGTASPGSGSAESTAAGDMRPVADGSSNEYGYLRG